MSINRTPTYRDFIEGRILDPVPEENTKLSTASDDYIPVVYGLRRVKAKLVWKEITWRYSDELVAVYALAMGPCYGIYRLFIDGVYVETNNSLALEIDDFNNIAASNFTDTDRRRFPKNGKYYSSDNSVAQFEFFSGLNHRYSKIIGDNIPNELGRPEFPNICYLVCKFKDVAGASVFPDIPEITVDLFGKMVTGAGNAQWTGTGFTGDTDDLFYSTNAADCLHDYLENEDHGAGLPADQINTTSFSDLKTSLNSNVTITLTNGTSQTVKAGECNMLINTGSPVQNHIDNFLNQYSLFMPYINGKFTVVRETTGSAEVTLTENSIVGEIRVTMPDANSRYNTINYSFADAERDFKTITKKYPPTQAERDLLITEDDGININEASFSGVTNPYLAEMFARQLLEKSRTQAKLEFKVFKEFYKYQVGDIININVSIPDLANVEARIVSMTLEESDLISVEAYTHLDDNYYPFTNFTQLVEDYAKPLIPVERGVLLPLTPTNPISLIPPTIPNPGSGEQGHPGEPSPMPILIQQPGDAPPTKPTEPDYLWDADTVKGAASLPTLGDDNEYYMCGFYNSSDPNYTIEYDARWLGGGGSFQAGRMVLINPSTGPGMALNFKLLHRNGDDTWVGYVYEVLTVNGVKKFGVYQPSNTGYPDMWFWDPENPSKQPEVVPAGSSYLGAESFDFTWGQRLMPFPYLRSYNNSSAIPGALVPVNQNNFEFSPGNIVYGFKPGSPFNHRVQNTGHVLPQFLSQVPNNLEGGTSSFTLDVKFFRIRNIAEQGFRPVFSKFIGTKTITFSYARITDKWLDESRKNYRAATPSGVEPPF
jgi:hypothetical protein